MILFMECLIAILLFTAIVIPVALINPKYIDGDYPPAMTQELLL